MEPRAIAKAPEGEGCPRCGGCVYAAEQMLARGRVSHSLKLKIILNLIHLKWIDSYNQLRVKLLFLRIGIS